MIKSFAHKGLQRFFERGSKAGINTPHADKFGRQLTALNNALSEDDMKLPGWDLHALTGNMKGHWAVSVSGNWRLTFKFEGRDAIVVDCKDYH